MLASVTQSYIAALLVERFRGTKIAKAALAVSAVASLGLLAYCKYADFFIGNFNAVTGLSVPLLKVALPVGISFYTFQILSYVIDVYRGDVPAQRNFIDLAMYVARRRTVFFIRSGTMKYKSRTHGRKQYRNVILENSMTLSYAIGTLKSCFAELYSAESFAVKVSVNSAAPKTETI